MIETVRICWTCWLAKCISWGGEEGEVCECIYSKSSKEYSIKTCHAFFPFLDGVKNNENKKKLNKIIDRMKLWLASISFRNVFIIRSQKIAINQNQMPTKEINKNKKKWTGLNCLQMGRCKFKAWMNKKKINSVQCNSFGNNFSLCAFTII